MNHRYDTDLSDAQWELIQALLPRHDPKKGGRPRRWSLPEILNAIFYIDKTGCQWRMLPKDLPPKETVWQQFRRWRDDATLEKIRLELNQKARKKQGRKPLPCAVIAHSQSVKTAQKGGSVASRGARSSRAGNVTG
jgi:putative transposase